MLRDGVMVSVSLRPQEWRGKGLLGYGNLCYSNVSLLL